MFLDLNYILTHFFLLMPTLCKDCDGQGQFLYQPRNLGLINSEGWSRVFHLVEMHIQEL